MSQKEQSSPLRATILYALIAIAFSIAANALLPRIASSQRALVWYGILEDVLFVSVTAGLIYLLVRRAARRSPSSQTEESARRGRERLDALWRLIVRADFDYESQALSLLEEGSRVLGVELGSIGHPEGDKHYYDFAFWTDPRWRRPRVIDADKSMARLAITAGKTVSWADLTADPATADHYQVKQLGLRCYIGTPFRVGHRTCSLGFGSNAPRERPFDGEDYSYVELLASYFARLMLQQGQEEQIRKLAFSDSLTALPNRARFHERLSDLIDDTQKRPQRFALLSIDLDRFKQVNDALGHAAGDQVLVEAAERLRQAVRGDDVVARIGGDEFAVLMPEILTPDEAERLASRIRDAVSEPFAVKDQLFHLTASIGIALHPSDGRAADVLLDRADVAAYRAKDEGRDRHRFYSDEIAMQLLRHQRIQSGLRRALERDEFVLHYQPQLDLRTGAIVAAETLLRWTSADGDAVPPAEFIAIAEEGGLMIQLGTWVLNDALTQLRRWHDGGIRLRLAVNVSARQFQDPALADVVVDALARNRIDPCYLELEVTETVAMANPAAAEEILTRCKNVGLRITLDDFGTFYSSLSYLKRLPVDALKMDRTFVENLPEGRDDAAIFRAVVALGSSLDRIVIAEGVENAAQLAWLRENGCALAQGYFIARPMSASDFERWLRAAPHMHLSAAIA